MRFSNNPWLTNNSGFSLNDRPQYSDGSYDSKTFKQKLDAGEGFLVKRDNVVANRYYYKPKVSRTNPSIDDFMEHRIATTKAVENYYKKHK